MSKKVSAPNSPNPEKAKNTLIAIKRVIEKSDLSQKESYAAMEEIMQGWATPTQIAAFLVALRMKGEQVIEITGLVEAMRKHAHLIKPKSPWVVDTCGTGGDLSNTFNISTAVAFVAAAAGVTVAKHGNRAISSQCGSADVLEALGAKIDLKPEQVKKCIDKCGIGFMFAPVFHPSMKNAGPVRREIKVRTVFNILGPLSNPASAKAQLIGVFHPDLTSTMAKVLRNLGVKHAMVVHGVEGLDEISIGHKTKITELKNGNITSYFVTPEMFQLQTGNYSQIMGGNAQTNAHIIKQILQGKEHSCRSDIVIFNTAAVLMLGKKAKNFKEGIDLAREILYSGKAYKKLQTFIDLTRTFK